MDLSYTNFNKIESLIISKFLKDNKSIYGFHFAGNFGYIDS